MIIKVHPAGKQRMWLIELKNELVGTCFIGDHVTICGTLETRSTKGNMDDHVIVIRAVSVYVHENHHKLAEDMFEIKFTTKDDWQMDLETHNGDEVAVRNQMIESLGREIYGLNNIKHGILVALCSGGCFEDDVKVNS